MDKKILDKVFSKKNMKKFAIEFFNKEKIRRTKASITKKFLDKLTDKQLDVYINKICKGYFADPYSKKPHKYVKEMDALVSFFETYGEPKNIDKEDEAFGHYASTYRGYDWVLFIGQGSAWSIKKGKKYLAGSW
jgi:hypothetical protein